MPRGRPPIRPLICDGTRVRADLMRAMVTRPLSPQMRRFIRWDDHRRDEFERTLRLLSSTAPQYYRAYVETALILGPAEQLVADVDLQNPDHRAGAMSAVRMSRMRGARFMVRYAGAWIESDKVGRNH